MVLVALSFASAKCSGAEGEVPAHFVGFSEADGAWLEQELTRWVSQRDRRLCEGEPGLTIELGELEVAIRFDFKDVHQTRTAARSGLLDELFRYQVAATAEELVRSTWEGRPSPRFAILARGEVMPLGAGSFFIGGRLGVGLFVVPSLCLELWGGGSALTEAPLPGGGASSGNVMGGAFSVSWLPLRLGMVRAGPRASVQAGALTVRVTQPDAPSVSGTTPWLALFGGATLGLELRHVALQLVGEVGSTLAGATVQAEGVPVQRVGGLLGTASVQVGLLW